MYKNDDEELRFGKACRERALGESTQSVPLLWDRFRVGAEKALFKIGKVGAPVWLR
jgi:hypothetical protein